MFLFQCFLKSYLGVITLQCMFIFGEILMGKVLQKGEPSRHHDAWGSCDKVVVIRH